MTAFHTSVLFSLNRVRDRFVLAKPEKCRQTFVQYENCWVSKHVKMLCGCKQTGGERGKDWREMVKFLARDLRHFEVMLECVWFRLRST